MSKFGFVPNIIFLSLTFVLVVVFRKKLAESFIRIKLPKLLLYAISSLPFMLIEENVNCLPSGCVLVPWTIPFLMSFVLILGIITMKLDPKSIKYPLLGFIASGVLWETLVGGLRGRLPIVGPTFYVFMVFWVGLSYAYFVIVPLTIIIEKDINISANGNKK